MARDYGTLSMQTPDATCDGKLEHVIPVVWFICMNCTTGGADRQTQHKNKLTENIARISTATLSLFLGRTEWCPVHLAIARAAADVDISVFMQARQQNKHLMSAGLYLSQCSLRMPSPVKQGSVQRKLMVLNYFRQSELHVCEMCC